MDVAEPVELESVSVDPVVDDLEDGELESDDSDVDGDGAVEIDPYEPLERPVDQVAMPAHRSGDSIDYDDDEPTDDDTDSDDAPCGKRIRMSAPSAQIPMKYRVWTTTANDDIADILTSFGMDTPENDRNVENYPVPKEVLQKRRKEFAVGDTRKRKVATRKVVDRFAPEPIPKDLDDVTVTEIDSIEEVADQIAERLQEPNVDLVSRIVLILGKSVAIEYFRKAREIESKGGLLILNGSRRRTSGGVFIHLIRSDKSIPGSKLVEIFEDPTIVANRRNADKRRKRKNRNRTKGVRKELNNPPPSPEVLSDNLPDGLPDLPDRRDLLNRPDPRKELEELSERRDIVSYDEMDSADFL
ncbi:phosphorylated adaptor for RNA export [Nesidiocoris tenuis]|uniref:Phosphorylated adapter RNA export protein n=1 Tax=Nesidiocoris tenuis TaxID=355587 RepID=A0ABN7BBZ6_9HEMI|nr:phosphorylated adaptor for RNA export [Nesidiocoris tenuis]